MNQNIYDAQGNKWTLCTNGFMSRNDSWDEDDEYETLLYWNRIVYRQNRYDQWEQWNGTKWIISTDPRLTSSTTSVPSLGRYHINSLIRFKFSFYTNLLLWINIWHLETMLVF